MKQLLIVAAILLATSCAAQTIPAEVKTAFAKSFPNTTVKKWDKEDGNYEATFSKDGKTMSATFDAKGNWIETETDIKVSELPASVISYINANYKGATVKEAAIISNPESKKLYEAEVKGKGLLFDEQGKFLKEEKD
jgi:Putative beta-lactamase-inhibitor-like, PepSY-like